MDRCPQYPSLSKDHERERHAQEADDVDEARHWQLWRECTRAEKLALRQLAEEGFLNPTSIPAAGRLRERLLLRRDPAFSLVTRPFARFVLAAEMPQTIAAWEASGGQSGWARLRVPLVAMAMIVAAYLLTAEPDALNWSIALATGVAAALPALLKLFSMLGDQSSGATTH